MHNRQYDIPSGTDNDMEMKPTSNTKSAELIADQSDGVGRSGRVISFQSLSNLPNIIFQQKLDCKVSV